jgi:hypothetical protein
LIRFVNVIGAGKPGNQLPSTARIPLACKVLATHLVVRITGIRAPAPPIVHRSLQKVQVLVAAGVGPKQAQVRAVDPPPDEDLGDQLAHEAPRPGPQKPFGPVREAPVGVEGPCPPDGRESHQERLRDVTRQRTAAAGGNPMGRRRS